MIWAHARPFPGPVTRFRRFKEASIPGGAMPVSEIPEYGTPEYEQACADTWSWDILREMNKVAPNHQANQRSQAMNKRNLPKYQCHKIVQAMQIGEIYEIPQFKRYEYRLYSVNPDTDRDYIEVSQGYIERHTPRVGGYYVLYEDGHESYSPKDAFEAGYTRLDRLGETVADLNEEAGYGEAQEPAQTHTDLPLYDPESVCPKCGSNRAATEFVEVSQFNVTNQKMRRTCSQCLAVRWERPLDDSRHGSTVFAGPGKNV